jgi:micrococcal nuclease
MRALRPRRLLRRLRRLVVLVVVVAAVAAVGRGAVPGAEPLTEALDGLDRWSLGLPGGGETRRGRVVRVVDGDTIAVRVQGRSETVRYIGVDTPETVAPDRPVECFGPQAKAFNERLVAGRRVRLTEGREARDRYGRLLAYVHADGRLVNRALVAGGYATTLEIEPNTERAGELAAAQRRARAARRGLWDRCRG